MSEISTQIDEQKREMLLKIFEEGQVGMVNLDSKSFREIPGHLGFPSFLWEIERFVEVLPLQLDPSFHEAHEPVFHPDRLEISLTFSARYRVTIPYAFIRQVGVAFATYDWEEGEGSAPSPQLRLIN